MDQEEKGYNDLKDGDYEEEGDVEIFAGLMIKEMADRYFRII